MTWNRPLRCISTALPVAVLVCVATAAHGQQATTLPARDRALTDRAVDVYSVGRAEGRSWEMFSGIRGVAFDARDNLYVLDAGNHRVLVFDGSGRFVREFGRRGSGPGELQGPAHIVLDRDGNLVVNDFANRAFIVFTPAGEHVRNVPFAAQLGMLPVGMVPHPRGGILARPTPLPMQANDGTTPVYRLQLAADAAPVRVVAIPIDAPRVSEQQRSAGTVTYRMAGQTVFAPRVSFGALPDGSVVYQHEAEYRLKVVDPDGRHVRTIARDIGPRRVTQRDQDAWLARRAAAGPARAVVLGGSGNAPASTPPIPTTPSAPTFADVMAVISEVLTDATGRIWVQRRDTAGADRGPVDLMAATGRYIGTLPAQALPLAVSPGGLAAYVSTDDMGVERVTVRRLPASWS